MKKAKKKGANEWNQVLEIHQNAMGTIRQTKKRSSDDEKAAKQKRWRRSNSETMNIVRQKLELGKDNFAAERDEKRNQNAILMNLIGQQQQMMAQQWTIFREIINKNNQIILAVIHFLYIRMFLFLVLFIYLTYCYQRVREFKKILVQINKNNLSWEVILSSKFQKLSSHINRYEQFLKLSEQCKLFSPYLHLFTHFLKVSKFEITDTATQRCS